MGKVHAAAAMPPEEWQARGERQGSTDFDPRNGESFQVGPVRPHKGLIHGHPEPASLPLIIAPVGLNLFAEAANLLLTGIRGTWIEDVRPSSTWKVENPLFLCGATHA